MNHHNINLQRKINSIERAHHVPISNIFDKTVESLLQIEM